MVDDDLATLALLEFLNASEAGIAAAKRLISEAKGIKEWNPNRIKWEPAEGASGAYERSTNVNNPEFKAMLKDLAVHGGKMNRDHHFYWVFRDGSTVGRKKRK